MNLIKAKKLIKNFLDEDIFTGDISAESIFDENQIGKGFFLAKDDGILCGSLIIGLTYNVYGADVSVKLLKKDGDKISKNDIIAEVEGPIKALLSCERVILNLMQRMSGISTAAKKAVELLNDENIRICDTRKTTPGLRIFEKYAVKCGGGYNHRYGLYDAVMLKDNHIAFAGGITNAVNIVKNSVGHMVKIEVETETEEEVLEAVNSGADVIMFDNRKPEELKKLCSLVPDNIITEASGGISLKNIAEFAGTGVNYISLGALTHSVIPIDISFNSMEGKKNVK